MCFTLPHLLFSSADFIKITEQESQPKPEEMEKKAIRLTAGEWTRVGLESQYELPKVDLAISFDTEKLIIKAKVEDSHFKDGHRSWRYGDGFFINIVDPISFDSDSSDRFHAFGFSLESGNPVAVLVNKDGTYFLKPEKNISININVDSGKNMAEYHIEIPWSSLYPLHPLLDQKAGINIIYISQNDDRSRKILLHVKDGGYDTEATALRRYAPLYFELSPKVPLSIAGRMQTRLISSDQLSLSLVTWSPQSHSGKFVLSLTDQYNRTVLKKEFAHKIPEGRSELAKKIKLPKPAGLFNIIVTLPGASPWKETFYKYDPALLSRMKNGIRTLSQTDAGPVLRNSCDAMTYRLTEVEKQVQRFTDRHDPADIQQNVDELQVLLEECRKNGSIYTKEGYLLSAFTSPLDSTLQAFSICLPENFKPEDSYNLLVTLHGSGVDEVDFLKAAVRNYGKEGFIIIGPRGRGLSDWYLGTTENDVVDLVKLVKELFRINKTVLYGFSMGGYGVWRMSFLHPELFDAAVCVSGAPYPLYKATPENDMRKKIGNGKDLLYVVIHGTEDRAVNINATDEFIDTLKASGYKVDYIRVEGGGHGNFTVSDKVKEWLKNKVFQ